MVDYFIGAINRGVPHEHRKMNTDKQTYVPLKDSLDSAASGAFHYTLYLHIFMISLMASAKTL